MAGGIMEKEGELRDVEREAPPAERSEKRAYKKAELTVHADLKETTGQTYLS
jgi:hypothetical protein